MRTWLLDKIRAIRIKTQTSGKIKVNKKKKKAVKLTEI